MMFGVLVKRINFHSRKLRKKATKSIENPPKIDVWGSLGTISEPLDKHLGHMLPKNSILEAFGSVLGAQDGQFHVLRTYRRAAGGKRKAEANGKAWALHF